ncbi:alpha-glucosidase [Talaromyces islandicus]|uniref:alpha-glucosidase n=1 Tax=Talaromyces islandicus TaxID=28573 RepID=A0A0U1M4Z7_TALIS|nr:alpha-glucosidase [Talaromyces islandicus]
MARPTAAAISVLLFNALGSAVITLPPGANTVQTLLPNIEDPNAVSAQVVCPGYTATNLQTSSHGITATMLLAGNVCNAYGTDVDSIDLTVEYQANHRLNIELVPSNLDSSNQSWYILLENLVPKPKSEQANAADSDLTFSWSNKPSFNFKFIEFVGSLPEDYNLYGLGERMHGLRLGNNVTATTYTADNPDPLNWNIYGFHPFYLDTRYYEVDFEKGSYTCVSADTADPSGSYVSRSHGVFLRSSHGQEVLLRPFNITWRTIGGSLDLYFYAGPTQAEVSKDYQSSTIGLPAMQQFWVPPIQLGLEKLGQLEQVVGNFSMYAIPLETMWSPVPLHENGMQYVPIIDPIIYYPKPNGDTADYAPYDRCTEANVWLTNPDGSAYIGAGWPRYAVYPDWHHPNTSTWWLNGLALWGQSIKFDVIWIDMNEAISSCVGSCGSAYVTQDPEQEAEPRDLVHDYPKTVEAGAADDTITSSYLVTTVTPGVRDINYPPYVINRVHPGHDLAVSAISPNATHVDGVQEYDVHDLYGYQETNSTYQALTQIIPGKRRFVLSRSTFAGSGKWAANWGGDNAADWLHMYVSILQALSFSLFGIPMFGVDTCGFEAWEFPDDPSLATVDRQFLLGPSLMIIPVLDQGATSVDGIFPGIARGEIWYDYYTPTEMNVQAGVNTTLDTPLGHIQLFIRGGSVLPLQQAALVTHDVRNTPWSLTVALSSNGTASGSLYVDDGESIVQNATLNADFAAKTTSTNSGSLYATVSGNFQDTNTLGNVTVLGVSSVGNVIFNGATVGNDSIRYDSTKCSLSMGCFI